VSHASPIDLHWVSMPILAGRKAPPLLDKWQARDPAELHSVLEQWADRCNIAFRLDGCLCLDPDTPSAETFLKTLELPPTLTIRTWRGHLNRLYLPPAGIPLKSQKVVAGDISIDVKAGHSAYVLGPGSHVHLDGQKGDYQWVPGLGPTDIEMATLPMPTWQKIMSLIDKGKAKCPVKSPETIHEGQRNDTLFRLASLLRHKNLAPEAILAALQAENQSKCSPPLPEAEVQGIANSAANYAPAPAVPEAHRPKAFRLSAETAQELNALHTTELGNAYRFQLLTRGLVRWTKQSAWLVWDGKRWRRDAHAEAFALVQRVGPTQLLASAQESDPDRQKALVKWAFSSEKRSNIANSLELATVLPDILIEENEFDQHPELLNVQNGIVDLRTGQLRKHDPAFKMTQIAPTTYDHTAQCTLWLKHLAFCFSGNEALIEHIQRVCGYMLVGNADQQCWWLFLGKGANGKTTIVEAMKLILGSGASGYAKHIDKKTLQYHHDREVYEVADLQGKRFVDANEFGARALNTGLLNGLCDGSTVSARQIYRENFEFTPVATFVVCSNHEPRIADTSWATWRRILRINFLNQVPEQGRVEKYWNTLYRAESAGILAWAVRGAVKLLTNGLAIPKSVKDITRQFELDSNPLEVWLREHCERGAGYKETAEKLYANYDEFAHEMDANLLTSTAFGIQLNRYDFDKQRPHSSASNSRQTVYFGLRLK